MNPEIVTFGCRLNAYESEVIGKLTREAGLADTVVINTCAVTAEAERQARQAIRRIRRERPETRIVVTGCAAQIDPARFAAMPEVDHVVGNIEKLKTDTWASFLAPVAGFESPQRSASNTPTRVQVADIMTVRETAPHLLPGFTEAFDAPVGRLEGAQRSAKHTRAFIEVQQGCGHRCTFCIIPFGRGPSRSAPLGTAVEQVRHYVKQGAKEAVLTGVDLTSWGHDLPGQPGFTSLVRRLLAAIPELERLRLSSLDPAEIDDGLLQLFADEIRLMPHLHLSLQAGDDLVLKRMKRRHSRQQALDLMARARQARPGLTLGADLIAGFPTEDEAMFGRTLSLIDEAGLDLVHIFPFSARPGTPAARMPPVPGDIVHDRARKLRAAASAAEARFLRRQMGLVARVLVEKSGLFGHAESFAGVRLDAPASPGSVVEVVIGGVGGGQLVGTMQRAVA